MTAVFFVIGPEIGGFSILVQGPVSTHIPLIHVIVKRIVPECRGIGELLPFFVARQAPAIRTNIIQFCARVKESRFHASLFTRSRAIRLVLFVMVAVELVGNVVQHPVEVPYLGDIVGMIVAEVRQCRAVEFIALAALAVAIFILEFLVITGTGREEECNGSYRRDAPPG